MNWTTIGLSVMATQASAITFISTPGQGYAEGMSFIQNYFGMPIALIVVSIFFIPRYYGSKVFTAYEYLEERFDLKVRTNKEFYYVLNLVKKYEIVRECYKKADHYINLASNSLSIFQDCEEKKILNKKNIQPGLAVILVGNNPASQVYVKSKSARFHKMGLFSETFNYKDNISEVQLLSKIEELNKNKFWMAMDISNIQLKLDDASRLDTGSISLYVTDNSGVDFPARTKRIDFIYHFLSFKHNIRLRIKITASEDETISSITSIFPAANWFEREAFDMYGIQFKDHPDLRRILTDYGFEGYPLRKDFPLSGNVEIRYDEIDKKIIHEPVNLQQDFRSFDIQSPWERTNYLKEEKKNNE